jgi:hypothetical protein
MILNSETSPPMSYYAKSITDCEINASTFVWSSITGFPKHIYQDATDHARDGGGSIQAALGNR